MPSAAKDGSQPFAAGRGTRSIYRVIDTTGGFLTFAAHPMNDQGAQEADTEVGARTFCNRRALLLPTQIVWAVFSEAIIHSAVR
jgi:hypothetical protein